MEVRRRPPRPRAFARRILAPGEESASDLVGAWTVKEAALKATREGLAADPRAWRFDDLECHDPRLVTAPSAWGPPENWAFLRTEVEGPAALALAVRLNKIHSLDVCVRSVHGPGDVSTPDPCSSFCLRWSPRGLPAASCAGAFRNRSDKVKS
ncbi:4'-phosphopantetheinyl transferase superfamily protein [Phenylobacterium sp. CCH12-B4]|uniref:4'-phosphopantetheinyl transferase family protein n=1 Tax=unclassified Phenylobacterium TaxID=2640670 RepID=UPI00350FC13F